MDGRVFEHDIGHASAASFVTNKVKPVEVGLLQMNVAFSAFQSFDLVLTPNRSSLSFPHNAST